MSLAISSLGTDVVSGSVHDRNLHDRVYLNLMNDGSWGHASQYAVLAFTPVCGFRHVTAESIRLSLADIKFWQDHRCYPSAALRQSMRHRTFPASVPNMFRKPGASLSTLHNVMVRSRSNSLISSNPL